MQIKWHNFKKYDSALAGYLFLWIVLGNLLGYVLSEHLHDVIYPNELLITDDIEKWQLRHQKCYPASNYGYEVNCKNQAAQWFWIILVSIPSMVIFLFSLNVALFHTKSIYEGIYFARVTVPVIIIIIIPAIYYWLKRNKKMALLLNFLFFSWIIYFNLMGHYR